jgi:hypothetical protein
MPDWALDALRNPGDQRWLAAAAIHDGAVMAAVPGSAVTMITHPEPPESPSRAAGLDFPVGSPVAGTELKDRQVAPDRFSQGPPRSSAPRI